MLNDNIFILFELKYKNQDKDMQLIRLACMHNPDMDKRKMRDKLQIHLFCMHKQVTLGNITLGQSCLTAFIL